MFMLTYKRILALLSGLLVVMVIVFIFPLQTALVFYKENTTNLIAFLPMKETDRFQFVFKHSIHLTDVVEKYEVTAKQEIRQYEIVFEEFGIGMPSNAEAGEIFSYEDGKYHIKNLNNIFPEIKIRNGKTVSEHRLIWNNAENEVYFNEYFDPGAWFTVRIKRLTLWNMLKGVKIHG